MNGYVKLGDDLDRIIEGYDENPHRADYQRNTWYKDGKKKAITHGMLGYDHEKALRLDGENGREGRSVGSRKSGSARRFWDYGEGHVFPAADELIRFGAFMHLDLYRIVALVLKGDWEYFYSHQLKGWRINSGELLLDLLTGDDSNDLREALTRFRPDTGRMHGFLEEEGLRPAAEGYAFDTFDALIQEMILSDMHRVANDSRELTAFVERKRTEQRLLREGSVEQRQAFLVAKCAWLRLQGEMEDIYLRIESLRLRKADVLRKWMTVFGKAEIALREQMDRCHNLQVRLGLKRQNPEMSRDEIEARVREEEKARSKELDNLRVDVALAPFLEKGALEGTAAGEDKLADYRSQCKKILRKIKLLVHPDHLMHHEVFALLTDPQKEALQKILNECLEIRPEELGYPSEYVQHHMRSLEELREILLRVESILSHAGIDTQVELIIRGEDLHEQLEWLERENRRLEREMDSARAELQALAEEREARQMREILARPGDHSGIRTELLEKAEGFKNMAARFERELEALYATKRE